MATNEEGSVEDPQVLCIREGGLLLHFVQNIGHLLRIGLDVVRDIALYQTWGDLQQFQHPFLERHLLSCQVLDRLYSLQI